VKIVDVRVIGVRVNHRGDWIFVQIETDDGVVGLGEASHSRDDAALARLVRRTIRPLLVGRDPGRVEPLWREMLSMVAGDRAPTFLEATAISGVEQALWDVNGRALGVPIHRLLGGAVRERVRVYANVNRAVVDRAPEGFAAAARAATSDGFTAVKLAPFDGVEKGAGGPEADRLIALGVERVRAVREAVGSSVDVMVDCHDRFTRQRGIEVAAELTSLDLLWFEEPIRVESGLDDLEALARSVSMPVAAGELLFGRAGFWPVLKRRSVATIMPDVKHCGGLWEGRKIAALAEAAGIAVSPHNPSGPIASLASVHLSATIPNCPLLEYAWGEVPWRSALVTPGEQLVDGQAIVPQAPGLGATLDEATLAEHGFDPQSEPRA
jgi:galactonate dehydratase